MSILDDNLPIKLPRVRGLGRIIPYIGSKRQLVPTLLPLIPKHRVYIEPFAGAASLFFEKPPASKSVLNDADKNLMGFYRKFSCEALEPCKKVKNVCSFSKKARIRIRKGTSNVCDQIAARRFSIVSDITGGHKSEECKIRPIVTKQLENQCDVYEARLKDAVLTSTDFRKAIQKHDAKDAFIYADPPYPGTVQPYGAQGVTPKEVCAVARKVKGKILVSYNDRPDIWKACHGLTIRTVRSRHRSKKVTKGEVETTELLIANFPLPAKVKRRSRSRK